MRGMRVGVFLVVLIAVFAILPVPSRAQGMDFREAGAAVTVSFGINKVQFESKAILRGEKSGKDLASPDGVLRPYVGEDIIGQFAAVSDSGFSTRYFSFAFATRANPRESDWTQMTLDDKYGWLFRIRESEFAQRIVDGQPVDTPLQFRVKTHNGEVKFLKFFIFKFHVPKLFGGVKDGVSKDLLFIHPCDPEPASASVVQSQVVADQAAIQKNFEEMKRALGVVTDNQQALADRVNENSGRLDDVEARMARMEAAWTGQAGNPPPCVPAATTSLPPRAGTREDSLKQKYAGRTGYVFFSAIPVTKSWWVKTGKGWVRAKNDLVISPEEESCWFYSFAEMNQQGWTEFGLGVGNSTVVDVYTIGDGLRVLDMEVR
jgi:hypothetical protein